MDYKYDLNTVDCLYTRTHIYQMIHEYENPDNNYIASIIGYKRKPINGNVLIVKNKITDVNNKITYSEDNIELHEIENILKDLFYHKGVHIKDTFSEIYYDNRYNIIENNTLSNRLSSFEYRDINIFNIPFRIYYQETKDNQEQISTYLQDIDCKWSQDDND